jgi:hypothetical protein
MRFFSLSLAYCSLVIYKNFEMKIDNLRRYIGLRDSLISEKSNLEQRLRAINEALGQPSLTSATPSSIGGRRGRPARGAISLRDAVLQVTSRSPLTKDEILKAVQGLGYKFSTSNPLNSLGVILYGKNPRFKNEQGRFSAAGGSTSNNSSRSGSSAFSRKKRQLSPEARERIAAAQRARWAKSKGKK